MNKRLYFQTAFILSVLLLLSGCGQEELFQKNDDQVFTLHLDIPSQEPDTRATTPVPGLPSEQTIRNYIIYFYEQGAATNVTPNFYITATGLTSSNRLTFPLTGDILKRGGWGTTVAGNSTKVSLLKAYDIYVIANYPTAAIAGTIGTVPNQSATKATLFALNHNVTFPAAQRAADGSDNILTGHATHNFAADSLADIRIPLTRNSARLDINLTNKTGFPNDKWEVVDVIVSNEYIYTPLFNVAMGGTGTQTNKNKNTTSVSILNYRVDTEAGNNTDGKANFRYYATENIPIAGGAWSIDGTAPIRVDVTIGVTDSSGNKKMLRYVIYTNEDNNFEVVRNHIYTLNLDLTDS